MEKIYIEYLLPSLKQLGFNIKQLHSIRVYINRKRKFVFVKLINLDCSAMSCTMLEGNVGIWGKKYIEFDTAEGNPLALD